ncbi:unnamed protein product [Calypogeia fissa]
MATDSGAGGEGGGAQGAGGSGGGANVGGEAGGDARGGEDTIARLVQEHLSATQLSSIDVSTPAGLASLSAILAQALQSGLAVGDAARAEETRKAEEKRKEEKRKKREENSKAGVLSTQALEKQRRREERDRLKKQKEEQKKKEEERKKLPLIALQDEGISTELAYTGAKSTIRHIVSTNFARGVEWGTLAKPVQKRVINQVKAAFRNGGDLDSQWLADKISNSMLQARYHDRMKIKAHLRELGSYTDLQRPLQFSEDVWNAFYKTEVQLKAAMHLKELEETMAKARKAIEAGKSVRDLRTLESLLAHRQQIVKQVGDPPNKFFKAAKRVSDKPPTLQRLGQGGLPGLKAAFYKRYRRKITQEEMETGQKHGKAHLFVAVDAALESEEEDDSDEDEEESSDDGDNTTPTPPPPPPPPPTGGGATSEDPSFVSARASGSGGRSSDGTREEEDEDEEDEDEDEEDEEVEEPLVAPPQSRHKRKERNTTSKKGGRKSRSPY